jgi:hypothetical protein
MPDFIRQRPVTNSLSETKGNCIGKFARENWSRKVKNRANTTKLLY